jgi:anthranilate phosphoribosyltransferase
MHLIASGEATPVQVGGFLIAQRMKGEGPEELAGFVDALRDFARVGLPIDDRTIDVDLHADGREGRPTVSVSAALVAAACGARVIVRGAFGGPFAKNDLAGALREMGIDPSVDVDVARRTFDEAGVAVLDLATYAPRIAELLSLREQLGVRTCVNSAVKLLDPAGTRRSLVGIFHGPYHEPVGEAARALGVRRAAVVQAPGGVPEPQPDKPTRISFVDGDSRSEVNPVDCAAIEVPGFPATAPLAAPRMTILSASLMLWTAGLAAAPFDAPSIDAAVEALRSGRAAERLNVVRLCYTRP